MISTLMSQNKIGIVLHGLVHESTKDIVSDHLYVGSYLSLAVVTFVPTY